MQPHYGHHAVKVLMKLTSGARRLPALRIGKSIMYAHTSQSRDSFGVAALVVIELVP